MPITDFPSDGETTCSLSGGNFRMASTALTERPLVFKIIETSKVLLTMKVLKVDLKTAKLLLPPDFAREYKNYFRQMEKKLQTVQ